MWELPLLDWKITVSFSFSSEDSESALCSRSLSDFSVDIVALLKLVTISIHQLICSCLIVVESASSRMSFSFVFFWNMGGRSEGTGIEFSFRCGGLMLIFLFLGIGEPCIFLSLKWNRIYDLAKRVALLWIVLMSLKANLLNSDCFRWVREQVSEEWSSCSVQNFCTVSISQVSWSSSGKMTEYWVFCEKQPPTLVFQWSSWALLDLVVARIWEVCLARKDERISIPCNFSKYYKKNEKNQ